MLNLLLVSSGPHLPRFRRRAGRRFQRRRGRRQLCWVSGAAVHGRRADCRQRIVMTGEALLGGYFGTHYALKLPQSWVRGFVIAVGAGMTT